MCRLFYLGGFWDGGRTSVVLRAIASRICSDHYEALLCNYHLTFSLCASMWGIHREVLTQPQLGRNPVLFNRTDQVSVWSIPFARRMLISPSVDEILLPRYINLLVILEALRLKPMNSVLFVFTYRPMPSAACTRICGKGSVRSGVFARSTRSSVLVIISTFCLFKKKMWTHFFLFDLLTFEYVVKTDMVQMYLLAKLPR